MKLLNPVHAHRKHHGSTAAYDAKLSHLAAEHESYGRHALAGKTNSLREKLNRATEDLKKVRVDKGMVDVFLREYGPGEQRKAIRSALVRKEAELKREKRLLKGDAYTIGRIGAGLTSETVFDVVIENNRAETEMKDKRARAASDYIGAALGIGVAVPLVIASHGTLALGIAATAAGSGTCAAFGYWLKKPVSELRKRFF